MVPRDTLARYLDELLEVDRFQDYCPNGLQVQGRAEIRRIVGGVTASLALVEAAAAQQADALLVHHGWFWKGESPCVTGMKHARMQHLLAAGMNLFAYHLPLDAHPVHGNNAVLGRALGLAVEGGFGGRGGPDIALYGRLPAPVSPEDLEARLERLLGRRPLRVGRGPAELRRLAWCTGAAQSLIEDAARLGVDAFLSGEISEPTVHAAEELGVHYFACGHHATERFGVQSLGAHLVEAFDVEFRFIDLPVPV
ncbi:MAG: Nif3-like dinuclear metal center hexameric protein [Gammaproteobacteria bacterium]|nr:MAG: Nif3-like dinuclear metal center hexameric protein [Gammaproteobacteria bacterium]